MGSDVTSGHLQKSITADKTTIILFVATPYNPEIYYVIYMLEEITEIVPYE
jgi:hypothetical protein